jgi:KipI family sensor histidine kinase inhibitor
MTGIGPRSVRPRVQAFGDAAVIVELPLPPGPETSRLVNGLADHLAGPAGPGWAGSRWEPPVPAATTILVPVDPVEPGAARAVALVEAAVATWRPRESATSPSTAAVIEIPVQYGGDDGPDLEAAAHLAGLSAEAVIELHSGTEYDVAFLGFAPGFAYLGPLPEALVLPRRPAARPRGDARVARRPGRS